MPSYTRYLNVQRNIAEAAYTPILLNLSRNVQGFLAVEQCCNLQRNIQGLIAAYQYVNLQRNIAQALGEDTRVSAWDSTDSYQLPSLLFPLLNEVGSYETSLWLWNDKSAALGESQTLIDVFVNVLCGNGEYEGQEVALGQEIVDEQWVSVKSNGVQGSGIVDDAEVGFTPIGGLTRHQIGDIPPQGARKIYIKVDPPVSPETVMAWALLAVEFEVE